MLKLRLKRNGRKRQPSYRLVIMENTTRREGRPVDQVGNYNSLTKELYLNEKKIIKWLSYGVQPTNTVFHLLKNKIDFTKKLKN
jgi:small subunit ribosomal protein S16